MSTEVQDNTIAETDVTSEESVSNDYFIETDNKSAKTQVTDLDALFVDAVINEETTVAKYALKYGISRKILYNVILHNKNFSAEMTTLLKTYSVIDIQTLINKFGPDPKKSTAEVVHMQFSKIFDLKLNETDSNLKMDQLLLDSIYNNAELDKRIMGIIYYLIQIFISIDIIKFQPYLETVPFTGFRYITAITEMIYMYVYLFNLYAASTGNESCQIHFSQSGRVGWVLDNAENPIEKKLLAYLSEHSELIPEKTEHGPQLTMQTTLLDHIISKTFDTDKILEAIRTQYSIDAIDELTNFFCQKDGYNIHTNIKIGLIVADFITSNKLVEYLR